MFLKTITTTIILVSVMSAVSLKAQCSFDVTVSLSPIVENNVYCPYDTVKLSTAGNFDTYQWYYHFTNSNTGGTAISGATSPTLDIPIAEWGFAYFYVVASLNGCSEPSPAVIVDSWAFLSPAIASEPQSTYCNGDSTLITNAFCCFGTFQWYRDGEPLPGATDDSLWVTESGYYVLFATPVQCPHTTLTSGVGPSFEFVGPQVPVITLQGNTLVASSGPNYQWYLNGQLIQGATSAMFQPNASGLYTVRVTDGSGCTPESAPYVFTVTAVSEPQWVTEMSFSPNPVADKLIIKNSQDQAPIYFSLFDVAGQQVTPVQEIPAGLSEYDMTNLPPATYYCRLQKDVEVYVLRLVKSAY